METVEFAYAVGQRVTVEANGKPGKVLGQYSGEQGHKFHVAYAADDGVMHDSYFLASQLAEVE